MKQLSEANTKLKADLKRAGEDLAEARREAERAKGELARQSDAQTLVVLLKQKEDEWRLHTQALLDKLHLLQEELHARLVEGEELHQQNLLLAQDGQKLSLRAASLEAQGREREAKGLQLEAKVKELSASLTVEQESGQKLKKERDALDLELRNLKEDLSSLRQNQSSSSDAQAHKLKELEVEKRSLK